MNPAVLAVNETVRTLHLDGAWVVIVTNGLTGAWSLAAHRFEVLRVAALWWFVAVAEVAVFVQVVLGVLLIQGRDTEPYQFHMLYGFAAAFTVAILYSYRGQLQAQRYLLYGAGGVFLMGLGLRSLVLGPASG